MSVDTFVFISDHRLPTFDQIQYALKRCDSGIILEQIDDLRTHVGYIPGTHLGQPSGFEWFYGPINDYFGGDPPEGLGNRGHVINLVTHSDIRELVCALFTAAAVAEVSDGYVLDEESGSLIDNAAALQVARDSVSYIK